MLANYEKRHFKEGEKIWLGRYQNLTNVLHWHLECEIILVIEGKVRIKIGDHSFDGQKGNCFFCAGEELHYIMGSENSLVDIMIFDKSIAKDITDHYALLSPKLPDTLCILEFFSKIKVLLSQKGIFYKESLENKARGMLIDIFRYCNIVTRDENPQFYKNLINKINDEFAFISFEDAVRYSGYSAAHFSKMFKKLSGMTFSEYLNIIKVENAILLMQTNKRATMTSISAKCGFATVRNYNRVFKEVTGYSPRTLPKDFTMDTNLRISQKADFDPTYKNSILIHPL